MDEPCVSCGFITFFHLGYCEAWLSMELSDELLSLHCYWYSFVFGSLLCIATHVNISIKYQLMWAKALSYHFCHELDALAMMKQSLIRGNKPQPEEVEKGVQTSECT